MIQPSTRTLDMKAWDVPCDAPLDIEFTSSPNPFWEGPPLPSHSSKSIKMGPASSTTSWMASASTNPMDRIHEEKSFTKWEIRNVSAHQILLHRPCTWIISTASDCVYTWDVTLETKYNPTTTVFLEDDAPADTCTAAQSPASCSSQYSFCNVQHALHNERSLSNQVALHFSLCKRWWPEKPRHVCSVSERPDVTWSHRP